ncbi:unnamed protein product [Coccothraustes coccothraustes]
MHCLRALPGAHGHPQFPATLRARPPRARGLSCPFLTLPFQLNNGGVTPCPGRREDKEGNAECTCACSPLRVCRRGCSILPVEFRNLRRALPAARSGSRFLSRECRELQGCRPEAALPSHPPPTSSTFARLRGRWSPCTRRAHEPPPCSAGAAAPPSPSGG